jgi:hypothetical protein
MKVSWDDEIPNIWKNKINVSNHQSENYYTNIEHKLRKAILIGG